jgi:hypothetical protein
MVSGVIVAAVQADLEARAALGLRKYGVTLDRTDLTAAEWLQHLYEELLDAACYIKRIQHEAPCGGTGATPPRTAAPTADAAATCAPEVVAPASGAAFSWGCPTCGTWMGTNALPLVGSKCVGCREAL